MLPHGLSDVDRPESLLEAPLRIEQGRHQLVSYCPPIEVREILPPLFS